jgi:hypothetical protein
MAMPARPSGRSLGLLPALLLAGCGGASNPSSEAVYPRATGFLADAPVLNLRYRTGTGTGSTGDGGAFRYYPGESVTFLIGDLSLPATLGRERLTPIEIYGSATDRAANQVNQPAFNLALLLLSLDRDRDPANGIVVSDATDAALTAAGLDGLDFNVVAEAFRAAIAPFVALSDTTGTAPATVDETLRYLAASLGAMPADSDGDGLFDYADATPSGGGDGEAGSCTTDASALVVAGAVTASFSFDLPVWAGLGLTPNAFIGAEGNGLPVGPASAATDLLDVPAAGDFDPLAPQVHPGNSPGAAYADAGRRTARPTSLRYDAADAATLLDSLQGEISLAGVSRWTVSPERGGGQLLFGDYNVFYNRVAGTWELVNRIDFPLTTFTLGNAQVTTAPGQRFTVTGDLVGSPALALLLGDALGRDFGDFRLDVACATTPAP